MFLFRTRTPTSSTKLADASSDVDVVLPSPRSNPLTRDNDNSKLEQDRNELFSGYNPEKAGSSRFIDGSGRRQAPSSETADYDEEVEGIKKQTRVVKQESLNSSMNALRMAREAEETARNTLTRLGVQSGIICVALLVPRCIQRPFLQKTSPQLSAILTSPRDIQPALMI